MNKNGLLRDFCRKVGISLEAYNYNFVIDFVFTKVDHLGNDSFTFSPDKIVGLFPVIKNYSLPSEFLIPNFKAAENLYLHGNLELASDKYKATILISYEMQGPVNNIIACCNKRLAMISYIERDYQSALSYMTKAIIIYEKNCEFDSVSLSTCYLDLSNIYTGLMEKSKSFNAFYKSYEIVSLIYPRNVSKILFLASRIFSKTYNIRLLLL